MNKDSEISFKIIELDTKDNHLGKYFKNIGYISRSKDTKTTPGKDKTQNEINVFLYYLH